MIKGIVFDMDGLMIDSERVVQHSWTVVGQKMGYGDLGEDIYHTLGLNQKARGAYFCGKYGGDFPYEEFVKAYREEYQRYVEECGMPAKKGLHEILGRMRELEMPMAVATSSSEASARKNLERQGITHYFQSIICGNMVTMGKPDPEIYLKSCEALGLEPACVVALEDSVNGIRSAYGAGMQTFMIPDLVRDISMVESMLAGKGESLLDACQWIESHRW